ncbi:hypothetical protein Bca4012_051511 [Brassica carinata]
MSESRLLSKPHVSHPNTQHLDWTVYLARNPLCVDLIYFRDVVCVLLLPCSTATVTLALPHESETESVMVFTCAQNSKLSDSSLLIRKVLRYFRKDGHNWRKKKDGETVKEAHEKLKVGSIDVLHCYYAHEEDNENFQRRCYWMLEQELMHVVFVQYLEVKV